MNDLRNRVRKLEEKIAPAPKRKIVFQWIDRDGNVIGGNDNEESNPEDLTVDIIKFCWIDNDPGGDGPTGPLENLSPDLREKLDNVYGPAPVIPIQPHRMPQEAPKPSSEE